MKKSFFNTTILTALFLMVISASIFSQTESINETFDRVKKVKLDVAIGDIEIVKSNSGKTELAGEYNPDKLDVEILYSNGNLSVIEKTKRRNNNGNVNSKYRLQIPDGLEIKVNTGTGDIVLKDVSAESKINTGTGKILMEKYTGDSKLNSGTGSVELINSKGEITLNSGTGDVAIKNSDGELAANSGTGDVEVENAGGKISANSGTGDVVASNIKLDGKGNFNSGTGDVKLILTGPVTKDLSVNSGTGSATLDMNGQNFNGTLVMACDKKSGSISAPFDFDKEETEDKTIKKYKYFGDSGVELKCPQERAGRK